MHPPGVEGVALQAAWGDDPFERGAVFCEATQPVAQRYEPVSAWRNAQKAKSIRRGRWKLIWAPYLDLRALYDLENDPAERYDLLLDPDPEHLKVRDALTAELRDWMTASRPLPSRFDASQLREVQRRLRSLGYSGN